MCSIYYSHIKNSYKYLLLLSLILVTSAGYSQFYSIKKGWLVGVHGGAVSFYGDLSVHDWNPVRKLTDESAAGYGFFTGKQLNRVFTLKVKYLTGSMKGSNPDLAANFTSDLNEFSLLTDIDLLELIAKERSSKFRLLAVAGAGYLDASAIKYSTSSDTKPPTAQIKRAAMITGLAVDYRLTRNLLAGAQVDLHTTWSDQLDVHEGNTTMKNDYYSYLSLNLTYIFNPSGNSLAEAIPCSPW